MPKKLRKWLKRKRVLPRLKRAFTNYKQSVVWLVRRWLPLRLFQISKWLQTPVKFPRKMPRWFWLAVGIAVASILAALFSPRPIAHSYYDQFRSLPLPVVTESDRIEAEKMELNVTSTPEGSCPVLSLRYPNKTGIITRGFTSWHPGIDWTTNAIDVYSSSVGEVVFSGFEGEYGLVVFVNIPGTGYQLRYAHLSRSYVLPGQEVFAALPRRQVGAALLLLSCPH